MSIDRKAIEEALSTVTEAASDGGMVADAPATTRHPDAHFIHAAGTWGHGARRTWGDDGARRTRIVADDEPVDRPAIIGPIHDDLDPRVHGQDALGVAQALILAGMAFDLQATADQIHSVGIEAWLDWWWNGRRVDLTIPPQRHRSVTAGANRYRAVRRYTRTVDHRDGKHTFHRDCPTCTDD